MNSDYLEPVKYPESVRKPGKGKDQYETLSEKTDKDDYQKLRDGQLTTGKDRAKNGINLEKYTVDIHGYLEPVADPGFGQGGPGGPNFETGRMYAE